MTVTARQREAWADRAPRRRADVNRVDVRLDVTNAQRVNVEPCPFCAVRSDVGCKHRIVW